jgi:ribosomal protein S15
MDTPEVATLVHELTPEEIQQARNEAAQKNEETHSHAEEALKRIFKVEHGNAQDRFKYNVKRCIDTFGRHNTDSVLLSKSGEAIEDKFRAGPDTGSSEVQIAVLTARIRKLANFLDTRGRKDIANKRSLRLLVHKRQKLLQYLRRKERGGPRWQNCISTLGLTEATWKGEITI